ncbi:MAG: hypothetical protein Q8O46_03910 [bacterium]|nr:hypothetical protein [bacterium]
MNMKFSPEEINNFRKEEEERLISGGAEKKVGGRLQITPKQYKNAHLEMWEDLSHRPIFRFEGESEIWETQTFTSDEIKTVIAKVEDIKPEDIVLEKTKIDLKNNIICIHFSLKTEIGYEKYGKIVGYFFQIAGSFTNKLTVPYGIQKTEKYKLTDIWRYLYTSETEEKSLDYVNGECVAQYKNGEWITAKFLLDEDVDEDEDEKSGY